MHESAPEPSISVALCTHNGAQYVGEQLRSILTQSFHVSQIVISDDCSSDTTLEQVRIELAKISADYLDVIILKNESVLGVTKNFEQAVNACTGDLIALCDQDDIWMPHRLERFVQEFQLHPDIALVFSDAQLLDAGGVAEGGSLFHAISFTWCEQRLMRSGRAYDVLLKRNIVTGATAVFRRELLDVAVPFPAAWVHDEWLAVIAAATGKVDFIREKLIGYRQHGSNEIGASKPKLGDLVGRVREPRLDRNRRLLARAQALFERIDKLDGVSLRVRRLAGLKVKHENYRNALPSKRICRVVPVLQSGLKGNYSRFGRARFDMLRDFVQPDR